MNSRGRTKCLQAGSDLETMTLDSWNSRSRRRVWLETRQTTGRPSLWTAVTVACVCVVVALASLPDDLWRITLGGRCASGECDAVGEVMELRPREGGLSWEAEAF